MGLPVGDAGPQRAPGAQRHCKLNSCGVLGSTQRVLGGMQRQVEDRSEPQRRPAAPPEAPRATRPPPRRAPQLAMHPASRCVQSRRWGPSVSRLRLEPHAFAAMPARWPASSQDRETSPARRRRDPSRYFLRPTNLHGLRPLPFRRRRRPRRRRPRLAIVRRHANVVFQVRPDM